MAGVLALPSLTGQIANGWPFLAQLDALRAAQLERVRPTAFLMEQPLLLGGAVILTIAGLGAMRHSVAAGVAGLFALGLVGLMLALAGKSYYAAPGYPALIAVGALALSDLRPIFRWLAAAPMVAATAAVLPMGIPVLRPTDLARYAARLGVTRAVQTNQGETLDLPQDYADMLGWSRLAEATAAVWRRLTPAEQAEGIVAAGNYGQAGALAMHHRRLGFPYPVSAAGDFHAWGFGNRSGQVAVRPAAPGALGRLVADPRAALGLARSRGPGPHYKGSIRDGRWGRVVEAELIDR